MTDTFAFRRAQDAYETALPPEWDDDHPDEDDGDPDRAWETRFDHEPYDYDDTDY